MNSIRWKFTTKSIAFPPAPQEKQWVDLLVWDDVHRRSMVVMERTGRDELTALGRQGEMFPDEVDDVGRVEHTFAIISMVYGIGH
jgi:hypothetical protein